MSISIQLSYLGIQLERLKRQWVYESRAQDSSTDWRFKKKLEVSYIQLVFNVMRLDEIKEKSRVRRLYISLLLHHLHNPEHRSVQ